MKLINYQNFCLLFLFLLSCNCTKDVQLDVDLITCQLTTSTHSEQQKYQDILDKYAQKGIPGITVVISKAEEDIWLGSSGLASIEDQIPMNPCHLHHTASLAKSFIGVITLQLIEEGSLSFDSKVASYLSAEVISYTPNIKELTVKHLLQQTSGIPDIFDINFFTELMNSPETIYSSQELLKFNEKVKPLYAPGNTHTYSDHNFILLSLIIDKVDGDHQESIKKRIIDPLGLAEIHYHDEEYPFVKGLTASYWEQYNDGKVENISDIQTRLTSYIKGSDGIIASPLNMTMFYKSVFENDLLSNNMLDLLKNDWVEESEQNRINTAYSHGFMILETPKENWIGHAGLQIGASCYVYYNPETGTTVGVFTNMGTFVSQEKRELIYGHLWNDLKAAI